ncbi:hypothetical protein C9974_12695 [Marinobacter sp. B9-2]|nr:hypothetical protein C9974_12695 [Marinobacter sp. B9-2]
MDGIPDCTIDRFDMFQLRWRNEVVLNSAQRQKMAGSKMSGRGILLQLSSSSLEESDLIVGATLEFL